MIKNILKIPWLRALLIFILISLVGLLIFRILTPTQPAIPTTNLILKNEEGSTTNFNNIRFTGSFIPSTNSLPMAVVQPSQTTLDYVKNQLIEEYQLQQIAGVSSLWHGETHTLSYDKYGDEYIFYSSNIHDDSLLADTNQAISSANNFVKATFPNLSLVSQKERVKYFKGIEELEEVPKTIASSLEVAFTYSIEGIPVYLDQERTASIIVLVNNLYEIQKVVFQPYFVDIVSGEQSVPLISLGEAVDNINNNKASIISAFEKEVGVFKLEDIQSGTMDDAQLEYRADLETGLVYPFYRFSGELINEAGQTIQAQLITPAVKTQ